MPDFGPGNRVIGRIAVIASDPWEPLRERISDAVNAAPDWQFAMRRLLDVLVGIVPHDCASFGLLADNRARFGTTFPHPSSERPLRHCWVDLPASVREQLAEGPCVTHDLPQLVRDNPAHSDDPVVQRHLAEGISCCLVAPVGSIGRPDAVLTLAARRPNAFDGVAVAVVSAPRLDSQMPRCCALPNGRRRSRSGVSWTACSTHRPSPPRPSCR